MMKPRTTPFRVQGTDHRGNTTSEWLEDCLQHRGTTDTEQELFAATATSCLAAYSNSLLPRKGSDLLQVKHEKVFQAEGNFGT
jgi:hypothetical protein